MASPAPSRPDDLLPNAEFLLSQIHTFSSPSLNLSEDALTSFCKTLDEYLQLPTLLDPILLSLLDPLLSLAKSRLPNLPSATTYTLCRPIQIPFTALYTLTKVRGVKPLARHLPHTIPDLHLLADYLPILEAHLAVKNLWHVRYVVYVWLSVAIRVPFPLQSIVPAEQLARIIEYAKHSLSDTGPVSDAAAIFLARLLSRRDAAQMRADVVNWATREALTRDVDRTTRVAGLSLLASLFKYAHRDDVTPYVMDVLYKLVSLVQEDDICDTTGESHLVMKLSVRLAMAVLSPKPAAWRYQRGERVVFESITEGVRRKKVGGVAGHLGDVDEDEEGDIEDDDMQVVERVVELLLMGLGHSDTVIRWSAAKGVGRVTGRLPLQFATDVVESVLGLFSNVTEVRTDAAWHGGCLAVAEMARRGLLLPKEAHFQQAFEVIARAAAFDMRRGANSVGAHVRDAACYAVWAIARAYSKTDVSPLAREITDCMLPVALLDREVNCRRAAAAALQECVGRLSEELFPEGIRLVTIADYFSLGDRVAAYLSIAPQVASLAGGIHFRCILFELSTRKLLHWDPTVRELAARALAALVAVDNENIIATKVVPELVQLTSKKGDSVIRHGAVLGLAEIAKTVGSVGLGEYVVSIRDVPKTLKENRLLSGKTGDEMRIACCHLIACMASGASDAYIRSEDSRVEAMFALKFLESIFGAGQEDMYAKATLAYAALCDHVISTDPEWHDSITERISDGLSNSGAFLFQRGFALAAGVCGDSRTSEKLVGVLCREITGSADVEVRRNSAISLSRIPERFIVERLVDILAALTVGMHDYATDVRGDIGSWVREASMRSIGDIINVVFDEARAIRFDNRQLNETLWQALEGIVQQCCGRIDRTRAVAGAALASVCRVFAEKAHNSKLSHVCKAIAVNIGFSTNEKDTRDITEVDFAETESIFLIVRRLLDIDELSDAVLIGLVSAGGGMGHQSRAALDALVRCFREESSEALKRTRVNTIVRIIEKGNERLMIPAFSVLQTLAKRRALHEVDKKELIALVKIIRSSWRQKLRNVKRTALSVELLGELAVLSLDGYRFDFAEATLGRECLEALVVVLGGSIPRLRRITAECIYMILIEFAVEDGEELDGYALAGFKACPTIQEAIDVLLDTAWEQLSILQARERRNLLCTLLHIRAPKIAAAMPLGSPGTTTPSVPAATAIS